MLQFFNRLSSFGAENALPEDYRRIKLMNVSGLLGVSFTLGYMGLYAFYSWWLPILFNSAICIAYVLVLVLNYLGRTRISAIYLFVVAILQCTVLPNLYIGPESGIHYFLFFFTPFSFLMVSRRDRVWVFILLAVGVGGFLFTEYFPYRSPHLVGVPEQLLRVLHGISTSSAIFLISVIVYTFDVDLRQAQQKLQLEYERSENLLLNILPDSIANRLKNSPSTIADAFSEASILFADIVGFTELSFHVTPCEIVDILNNYFSAYDDLASKHQVEKIKTIGDAYMVAAGIPDQRADHAAVILRMAIDMIRVTEKISKDLGQELQIRVGINSGPVTAGVIGKRKFIYDLWGDSVNIASRMESHGVPGRIQVTESTYQLLKGEFPFKHRGQIEIKGKGTMDTYLLETDKVLEKGK